MKFDEDWQVSTCIRQRRLLRKNLSNKVINSTPLRNPDVAARPTKRHGIIPELCFGMRGLHGFRYLFRTGSQALAEVVGHWIPIEAPAFEALEGTPSECDTGV